METLEDRRLLAINPWSGDIPDGTIWRAGDIQHLTSDVRIPADSTLTIEPGAIVKFGAFHYDLVVQGTLDARGTAQQNIIFTEFRDDVGGDTNGDSGDSSPTAGNWGRIEVAAGGTAILEFARLRFGGYDSSAQLVVKGGVLNASNSTISNSLSHGVRIESSNPVLANNTYENNAVAAISMDLKSNPSITGSSPVVATGNVINGLLVDTGTLEGNGVWDDPDIVYVTNGDITVPAGQKLTIAPGQVIKMGAFHYDLFVNGTLDAQGTSTAPIIFTEFRDDSFGGDTNQNGSNSGPSPGNWGRIELAGPGNLLRHVELHYGGYDSLAQLRVKGGELNFTDGLVKKSLNAGLRIETSNPIISNVQFIDNAGAAIRMDLASNPAITGSSPVVATGNAVNGLLVDMGALAKDGSWNDPDIVYVTDGDITVPQGTKLTVAPGQVVKLGNFHYDLIVNGTLDAQGTSSAPIVFTEFRDDASGGDTNNNGTNSGPSPGNWGRIELAGSGNILRHVELRNGGYDSSAQLRVKGGELEISDSIIRRSLNAGLRIESSNPTISDVEFIDNIGAAARMDLASNPVITGSSPVVATDNAVNGLLVDAGTLVGNGFWNDPDIVYVTDGDITVPAGNKLTMAPGQVVKLGYFHYDLFVRGTLDAQGTADSPIVFTEFRDDSVGGDTNRDGTNTVAGPGNWGRIELSGPGNILRHVDMRNGGYDSAAQLRLSGGELALSNSIVQKSLTAGMRIELSDPSINNVQFLNNAGPAVRMDLASNPAITGSSPVVATGNSVNGLLVDAGTLVRDGFWDDADLVYVTDGDITVPAGRKLTVAPGQVIKLGAFHYDLFVNGTLDAQGAPSAPIVFTEFRDDSVGGDTNNDLGNAAPSPGNWGRIAMSGPNNRLDHVEARFGGYDSFAMIHVSGGDSAMSNMLVRSSITGGISVANLADVSLENALLLSNAGNAVQAITGATLSIANSTIDSNFRGALVDGVGSRLNVTNSLITNNQRSGIQAGNRGLANVQFSDVFNPTGADGNYSGMENQTGIDGNLSVDPLFVDRAGGNFHLQGTSPAVDAGTSDSAPDTDFDFNRRHDHPDVSNTGSGTPSFVDLGVFEFGGLPSAVKHRAAGDVSSPVNSVVFTFRGAMDTSSFATVDDIVSFSGPTGPIGVSGFRWRNAYQLEVSFPTQSKAGSYQLVLGSSINDADGDALDHDGDGIHGENPGDRYTASWNIVPPRVVSHTPRDFVAGPIDHFIFNFDRPMDQQSFSVEEDVLKFTGPQGNLVATGFNWVDSRTLEVRFEPQAEFGFYEMTLSSQIRDLGGNLLDQDRDRTGGETPADHFAASFTLADILFVSGPIDIDTTWSGVVIVQDDVTVNSGATLTIQPGTIVKLSDFKRITVNTDATLNSLGTSAQPVRLTSIHDDTLGGDSDANGNRIAPQAGDWITVHVAGGTANFESTHFSYGGGSVDGIWNQSGMIRTTGSATVNLSRSVLKEAFFDGVLTQGGTTVISNSVITGADRGVVSWLSAATVQVVNSTFDLNRIGLLGHGGALNIENTIVSNSLAVGIDNDISPAPTVRFSDIFNPGATNTRGFPDPIGSNGNVSLDPQFKDAARGNYRLDFLSPVIDSADGPVAPSSDHTGAPRYDAPHRVNTGTATTDARFADMGAFEFIEGADSKIDLVVENVGIPAAAIAGQKLAIQWTTHSRGAEPALGTWHDGIYLSRDPVFSPDDLLLAEVLHSGDLGLNQSYQATGEATIPHVLPGNYYILVRANSDHVVFEGQNLTNNSTASTTTIALDVAPLAVGGTVQGEFTFSGETAVFRIDVPAGIDVEVVLEGAAASTAEMYVRHGDIPSQQEFDRRTEASGGARVLISSANHGRNYVLVRAATVTTPLTFTLRATAREFSLDRVTPTTAGNQGSTTFTLRGAKFTPGSNVRLTDNDGGTHEPTKVQFVDSGQLLATFDLVGIPEGPAALSVIDTSGAIRELDNAVTITHENVGELKATLVLPSRVRAGRPFELTIEYENTGGADLLSPVFELRGLGIAKVGLARALATHTDSVLLIGVNPEAPAGVLAPGARGSLTLYGSTTGPGNAEFNLNTGIFDSAAVPWEQFKASMRPSALSDQAWDTLFARIVSDVGSTWAEFQESLAEGVTLFPANAGNQFLFRDVLQLVVSASQSVLGTTLRGSLVPSTVGASLDGVEVRLISTSGNHAFPASAQSDGTFVVPEVPAGQYTLEVLNAVLVQPVAFTVGTNDVDLGEIVIERGSQIAGQVLRESNGAPVENADVVATRADGVSFSVITDTTGNYQLVGIPNGNYEIRASAAGMAPSARVPIAVSNNNSLHSQNLVVATGATISGQLVGFTSPLPAGSSVYAVLGTDVVERVTPESNGQFILQQLPAGPLTIVADVPGYISARSQPITVTAGQTIEDFDLAVVTGGTIRGRYAVAGTDSPRVDHIIELVHSDGGTRMTETDANGEFEARDLRPGRYEVRGSAGAEFRTNPVFVDVTAGAVATADLTAQPAGVIQGTVRDSFGDPIPFVTLAAVATDGERFTITARDNGTFTFRNLAPGVYSILLGDEDGVGIVSQAVTLPADSLTATADLVLPVQSTIQGTVADRDGTTPLEGVLVSLFQDGNYVAQAFSDADGTFTIQILQNGSYVLTAVSETEFFTPRILNVDGSNRVEQVQLVAGLHARLGHVHDTVTNSPMANASVELYLELAPGESELVAAMLTDADGNFALDGLAAGKYELIARADNRGFAIASFEITGEEGESSPVTLSVGPSTTVEGTVVNSDTGLPISGALVQVNPLGRTDYLGTTKTDTDGKYKVDGLAAGQYDVVTSSVGRTQVLSESITTTPAAPAQVQVQMPAAGAPITVQLEANGQPIAGAGVEARDANGRLRQTTVSGPNGQAILTGLPQEPYAIFVNDTGGGYSGPLLGDTRNVMPGDGPEIDLTGAALNGLASLGDQIAAAGYLPMHAMEWFLKLINQIEKDANHPGDIQPAVACPNYFAEAQRLKRRADEEFKSWQEAQYDYSDGFARGEAAAKVTVAISKVAGVFAPFIAKLKDIPGKTSALKRLLKAKGTNYEEHVAKIKAWNELTSLQKDVVQVIGDTRSAASSMNSLIEIMRLPLPPAGSQEEIDRNLQISGALNDFYALANSSAAILKNFSTRIQAFVSFLENTPLVSELKGFLDFFSGVVDAALAIRDAYNDVPVLLKKVGEGKAAFDNRRAEYKAAILRANQSIYAYLDCESQKADGAIVDDFIRPPVQPNQRGSTASGASADPNDKTGPAGVSGFIEIITMPFLVQFENDPNVGATLPAQEVIVTDPLDSDFDLNTFEFKSFGFNNRSYQVPPGLRHYETTIDLRAEGIDLLVPVTLDVNLDTRVLTARFGSLDPVTLDFPDDVDAGFLPVNDKNLHNGEGFFSYSVRPNADSPSGTELLNQASIVFDINAPIVTPQTRHILDLASPTSQVTALPATSNGRFNVTWSGSDGDNGSGIATYDVFVSDNGAPFVLFVDDTQETSAEFVGTDGHTYRFYSVATDRLGHNESAPAQPDTQTEVMANAWQNPADPRDVNPDGNVVPLDVLAVINELNGRNFSDPTTGKLAERTGDATFYYDVNGDTFATPLDALNIINFLNSESGGEGESFAIAMEALDDEFLFQPQFDQAFLLFSNPLESAATNPADYQTESPRIRLSQCMEEARSDEILPFDDFNAELDQFFAQEKWLEDAVVATEKSSDRDEFSSDDLPELLDLLSGKI